MIQRCFRLEIVMDNNKLVEVNDSVFVIEAIGKLVNSVKLSGNSAVCLAHDTQDNFNSFQVPKLSWLIMQVK